MERLQRKCIVASAVMHVLLLSILFLAPAFLPSRPPEDDLPILEFVPMNATDELMSGGGTPNAQPPAVQPRPPAQQPPASPQPTPPPPKVETPPPAEPPAPKQTPPDLSQDHSPAQEEKLDPEAIEPAPPKPRKPKPKAPKPDPAASEDAAPEKPRKKQVNVNLDLKKRYPADTTAERERKQQAEAREAARVAAERAAERAASERMSMVQGSLRALSSKLSGGTSVDIPGPGGEAYANFNQIVRSIYDHAWIAPDDVADDSLAVTAKVTIQRDGSVIASQTFIQRASGNPSLDKSVQRAIDRVRNVAPFPEASKDSQRTFYIHFNLKTKRQNG